MEVKVKYVLQALSNIKVKGGGNVFLNPLSKIAKDLVVNIPLDASESQITEDDLVNQATDGTYKSMTEVPAYTVDGTGYMKLDDITKIIDVTIDETTHEVSKIELTAEIEFQYSGVYLVKVAD